MDLLIEGLRYIEQMMAENPEIPAMSWTALVFIGVIIWYFVIGQDEDRTVRKYFRDRKKD